MWLLAVCGLFVEKCWKIKGLVETKAVDNNHLKRKACFKVGGMESTLCSKQWIFFVRKLSYKKVIGLFLLKSSLTIENIWVFLALSEHKTWLPTSSRDRQYLVLVLRYWSPGRYWYWYWYCNSDFPGIGIGIGIDLLQFRSIGIGIGIDLSVSQYQYQTHDTKKVRKPSLYE